MATEDQQTQDRLNSLLVLVKEGSGINKALIKLGGTSLQHWYYRTISEALRRPITAAAFEYQRSKRQMNQIGAESPDTSVIWVDIPTSRKNEYQDMCTNLGTNMNRRISSLVAQDLAGYKAGL